MKVDFTITRVTQGDCIFGVLNVTDNDFRCFTLERPYLDNARDVSAVPPGYYEYFYRVSPSNGKVLELRNVIDRTAIQIHIGNWIEDSLGCILVGETAQLVPGSRPMVTSSGKTMGRLLSIVPKEGIVLIQ